MRRFLIVAAVVVAGCAREGSEQRTAEAVLDSIRVEACPDPAAQEVVTAFGSRLRQVSVLAPDSLVRRDLQAAYGDLVSPELLSEWLANPRSAPGRQTSNPWPARIQLDTLQALESERCQGTGVIENVLSDDTLTTVAQDSVSVRVHLADGGWRIEAFRRTASSGESPDSDSVEAAVAALREYYAAINAKDYRRAYELWGDGGRSSGKTFEEFAAGFADTEASVLVSVNPGPVEGAAGSRYSDIATTIESRTKREGTQRFEGTYTMRRVVVDGATPLQRRWHIDRASIQRAGLPR